MIKSYIYIHTSRLVNFPFSSFCFSSPSSFSPSAPHLEDITLKQYGFRLSYWELALSLKYICSQEPGFRDKCIWSNRFWVFEPEAKFISVSRVFRSERLLATQHWFWQVHFLASSLLDFLFILSLWSASLVYNSFTFWCGEPALAHCSLGIEAVLVQGGGWSPLDWAQTELTGLPCFYVSGGFSHWGIFHPGPLLQSLWLNHLLSWLRQCTFKFCSFISFLLLYLQKTLQVLHCYCFAHCKSLKISF